MNKVYSENLKKFNIFASFDKLLYEQIVAEKWLNPFAFIKNETDKMVSTEMSTKEFSAAKMLATETPKMFATEITTEMPNTGISVHKMSATEMSTNEMSSLRLFDKRNKSGYFKNFLGARSQIVQVVK